MNATTDAIYATCQSPEQAQRAPAIAVKQLYHWFGEGELKSPALVDVNLEVAPGEIVIMKGPSGSGKTTLLTLIGTLRSAQGSGSLQVLGHELQGAGPSKLLRIRRDIGFIFQAHNLFESLTAFQNVRMGIEMFDVPRAEMHERVTYLLTRLGLGHRLNYKPDSLSGGQKQRVAVARGLVHRPKLILADEPTAALDQQSARDVVTLFQEYARQFDSTVVVVTHDDRIIDVADRMIKMETGGRIVSNVVVREAEVVVRFLKQCRVFEKLGISELATIGDKMLVERYAKGERIIRQGDVGDKFYLIRSGRAEARVGEAPGYDQQRRVGVLETGNFFGEAALITGEPRNANVYALEETLLYTLGKQDFQAVLASSLSVEEELRKAIFDRRT